MDFIFYLTLMFFIMIFSSYDNIIDYDFWARLTVGKSFFQTGTLFNFDFQSFGTTHQFIDHEWGSSLIFYLIQNNFNDIGIYIFKVLIIFLTLFFLIKVIKLKTSNVKLHFLFFFFCLQAISYNIFSTVRCQTLTFLFFSIFLYALEYSRIKNNYRVLVCLPLLSIIWQNCHGGFVMGLSLILIYALGIFLNEKDFNKSKPYLFTFLASLGVILINPYGIKYLFFIIDAFRLNRIFITEWQSAFFYEPFYLKLLKFKIAFAITSLIFIYSIIKNIKTNGIKNYYNKIDKVKYLLIIFTILISLKSLRCHVFFIYTLIAFCYVDFYNIFNKKLPEKIDNFKEIIIFFLISISMVSHLYKYKFINRVPPSVYPVSEVEFIKLNNLKGNVFVNFHLGSYVAYKLYPNNFVFMDGRYEEVYDVNLINDMAKIYITDEYKFYFSKYHFDMLIVEKSYPLFEMLKKDKDFSLVFEDDFFGLFLDNKLKKDKYIIPTNDLKYYNKEKFKTNINWIN